MQYTLILKSRADMVEFGRRLGVFFVRRRRPKPWITCLNGDSDSGKSLVALAIDCGIEPTRYGRVLSKRLSADSFLDRQKHKGTKTVFNNFMGRLDHSVKEFDQTLRRFEVRSPNTIALVASNIDRSRQRFNYSWGLQSTMLDIDVHVRMRPFERFKREITCTFEDPRILPVLQKLVADLNTTLIKPPRHGRNRLTL